MDRDRALKDIRNAWVAAYVSAGVIVVAVLVARFGGVPLHGVNWGSLLEIAILMALAFGVHMKSRAASVVLLGYFLTVQVLLRVDTHIGVSGIFVAVLLGWFYVRGVMGTIAYHRLESAQPSPDEELVSA
jgi:hypothetical protein